MSRGKDSVPAENEDLSQVIGSDVDRGDEQDLVTEGRGGELHLNEHDQDRDMFTNTCDSRDIGELSGEQCPDTRVGPIPGEEEKRILVLLDTETGDMDTEADNTQVLNECC